jgi:hypothetical protein
LTILEDLPSAVVMNFVPAFALARFYLIFFFLFFLLPLPLLHRLQSNGEDGLLYPTGGL